MYDIFSYALKCSLFRSCRQPLVCFSYVNIIAIPTTRLICNVGQLSTGKPVLVREKKTLYDERFGKIYRLKRSPKKKKFYDLEEDI